jgi:hypothetical protein
MTIWEITKTLFLKSIHLPLLSQSWAKTPKTSLTRSNLTFLVSSTKPSTRLNKSSKRKRSLCQRKSQFKNPWKRSRKRQKPSRTKSEERDLTLTNPACKSHPQSPSSLMRETLSFHHLEKRDPRSEGLILILSKKVVFINEESTLINYNYSQ